MDNQNILYILSTSELTIIFLGFSIAVGLLLHANLLWPFRKILSALISGLIGVSTGLLIVSGFNLLIIILIALTQSFRLFSFLRVVKDRVNPLALNMRSFRTELVLCGFILIFTFVQLTFVENISSFYLLLGLAITQFISVLFFLYCVRKSAKTTLISLLKTHVPDVELPSITVAIPARNETAALTDCLQSILQNDYPKMEIVVLDDCSQDSTSDIIKSFAHQGVRFLEGTIPKGSWLSKNHAYDQLFQESEGKLILFCGVDVRFEKDSIRKLVEIYVKENQKMISVLPTRNGLVGLNNIIQPMRYWRELAIPKVFSKHPACLGTCWLIERKYLSNIGGFLAFKQNISPEKHFAKRAKTSKQYRFYVSSSGLGISSIKNYRNQWLTSLRTRYPEHKKQPENVFIFTIWFAVVFASPFAVTVISLFSGYVFPAILGLFSTILLLYVHFEVHQ